MSLSETPSELDEAAAQWVVRLASGAVSSVERRAFEDWLARSDRHYGAYMRARAAWMALGAAQDGREDDNPAEPIRDDPAEDGAGRSKFTRRGLIAASLGTLFAGALGLYAMRSSPTRIATGEGEQRRLLLGPGRSVLLNTQSAVTMSCKGGNCGPVAMLRGEALFSTVANSGAPLIVECRDLVLKSLNGLFSVALGPFDTRVTVARGLVQLVGEGSRAFAIEAGSQAIVAQGAATLRKIDNEELGRTMAWSTGHLVFSGETLADAAAMINRYNRLKVGLGRGAPAQEALVGRFSINDPQAFADAVAAIYGLRVRHEGEWLVLETGSEK